MRVVQRPAVTAAAPAPAKWRVIGELRDETELPGLLEWRDPGGLSGSPEAMKAVTELLTTGLPVAVTPTGPFIAADRHDEQSAYVIAGNVLNDVEVVGAPPALPPSDVPDGAIA